MEDDGTIGSRRKSKMEDRRFGQKTDCNAIVNGEIGSFETKKGVKKGCSLILVAFTVDFADLEEDIAIKIKEFSDRKEEIPVEVLARRRSIDSNEYHGYERNDKKIPEVYQKKRIATECEKVKNHDSYKRRRTKKKGRLNV